MPSPLLNIKKAFANPFPFFKKVVILQIVFAKEKLLGFWPSSL